MTSSLASVGCSGQLMLLCASGLACSGGDGLSVVELFLGLIPGLDLAPCIYFSNVWNNSYLMLGLLNHSIAQFCAIYCVLIFCWDPEPPTAYNKLRLS